MCCWSDIRMPDMSGLQMVEHLAKRGGPMPAVIFVTAYQEHAVEAFEKRAVDYVLKPFVTARVHEALDIALRRTAQGRVEQLLSALQDLELRPNRSSRLAIKDKGRVLFVDIGEIVSVEANGNYVLLQQKTATYVLRESIASIAMMLKPGTGSFGFIDPHWSMLDLLRAYSQVLAVNMSYERKRGRNITSPARFGTTCATWRSFGSAPRGFTGVILDNLITRAALKIDVRQCAQLPLRSRFRSSSRFLYLWSQQDLASAHRAAKLPTSSLAWRRTYAFSAVNHRGLHMNSTIGRARHNLTRCSLLFLSLGISTIDAEDLSPSSASQAIDQGNRSWILGMKGMSDPFCNCRNIRTRRSGLRSSRRLHARKKCNIS